MWDDGCPTPHILHRGGCQRMQALVCRMQVPHPLEASLAARLLTACPACWHLEPPCLVCLRYLRAYLRCDRDLEPNMTAWISLNRPQVPFVILHDADEARTKTSNGSTIAE